MASPKRDVESRGHTRSSISHNKSGNRLDCSSDYCFKTASQRRLTSRESPTTLPPFKQETSPFHTLNIRALSPPQYDLSFVKLPQLVSKVGIELAVRESVWNEGPCLMASAFSADIPVKTISHSSFKFNVEQGKPTVKVEKTKTRKKYKPKSKTLTGTEVFEILAKKKHLGDLEFYYLKASEDGPYRPYDLYVVPQSAAGSDYYTFSPTAVIHMKDGCSEELLTLAEWYQESVVWRAVRDIPFFRDYLLRKAFKRWHRNVCKVTFRHRADFLSSQLLIAVPQFRDALLQLSRLIEELKQIHWLPQDNSRTYTLLDFQTAVLEKNQAARVSLHSFLHCRAVVLDMVKNISYQAHQELQTEVEHSKLNVSSQSLHLHLTSLRNLQKELSWAEKALQRLGNLAALADHITVQNLVTISKREVTTFLNYVLKRQLEQQGGLFQAEIVFRKDGQLTVFPPLHLFQEVLFEAVQSVADSVLQVFESCSLSCDNKDRPSTSSVLMSGVPVLTANTSRACTKRTTHISEFKDKVCKITGPPVISYQKEHNASPQTIVPVKINSLRVQAQRVHGQFLPLPQTQLKRSLKLHTATLEVQTEAPRIIQEAIKEVHQLCEGHSWLIDVHLFTSQWALASLEALRGCPCLKYEELIKKLHNWMDRLYNMPLSVTISNKLFTVNISNIQEKMGFMLSTIDEDVLNLLREDWQSRFENLASELKGAGEVLKSEPTNFHDFIIFLNMVKCSELKSDDMNQRLKDLHSLQEIVRMNYTQEVGVLSVKQIDDLWNQFAPILNQATHVVTRQLPSMLTTLDSNFSSLAETLENLVTSATSGSYVDPDQNATEMLVQLEAMCSQFCVIAEQLNDQSRASEIIRAHPLDLTFVTIAQQRIEARKELWELMSVSSAQIQEWKLLKFSKFVIPKAQDKIREWLQQAEVLAKIIPSHDAVLQKILQILHGFDQKLHILSKSSSSILNHKHWRRISQRIGLQFEPDWKLTLGDLMSKELEEHKYEINKVYLEAKAEADMEQTFRMLRKHWEGAEFWHARFIIAVQNPKLSPPVPPHDASKQHIRDSGTFTIIALETLLAQTKESVMVLSDILLSSHAFEFHQEVEHWLLLLQELDKLLDLYEKYQHKWTFLSKTFNETSMNSHESELQEKFHPVDKMYREIIQFTVKDPHVLSFVEMSKTKKASDSFQGENLHSILINGLMTMEEISNQLLYIIESPRSQFPRLCFLSDGEVMKLLSLHPTPSSLLPLVQKCFRGVQWLDSNGDENHEHELTGQSNELMWVHGIYGAFGEHVPFLSPLEPNFNPVAWLQCFEQKLHQAMKEVILKCIAVQQCSEIEDAGNNSEVAHESPSLLQLISQYPLQCILVAEEVLWCSVVQKSFHNPAAAIWAQIKSQNAAKLQYLCHTIQNRLANSNDKSSASKRIMTTLRALVMLTMKHSNQTDALVEIKGDLESSFEWHKLMKYHLSPCTNQTPCEKHPSQESVFVDILCTQLPYGFEYIGPENWLMVTTPSTEQAYLGIILALSSYKCAFISGPHMSGKQYTAVQLGYALGRQVVTLQCSSNTSSSFVFQMLLGALQSGAWLVLDSVDSIGQGALSALGQHLTDIYQHLSAVQRHAEQGGHEVPHDVLSKLSCSGRKCNCGESFKKQSNTVNDAKCHIAGKDILVKLSYGCITISSNGYSTEVPENFRIATRPVSLIQPHYRIIAEVMLASLGFSEAATISRQLVSLFSLAKDSHCLPHFLSGHQTSWLVLLRNVIAVSGRHLHRNCCLEEMDRGTTFRQTNTGSSNTILKSCETVPKKIKGRFSPHYKSNAIKNAELEEQAAIKAVLSVMVYTIPDPKRASQFHTIFEEIFPKARCFPSLQQFIEEMEQNILKDAVKEELQTGCYPDTQMLCNVLTLYQALKLSNVVVLVGPAGSGKTTLYQILVGALQKLARDVEVKSVKDFKGYQSSPPCWTSVNTEVIFPNALSHKEFFGGYSDQTKSWYDGALTKALRFSEHFSPIAPSKSKKKTQQIQNVKWIVLDGDPVGKPSWLDSLSTLFNPGKPYLCLSSGEKVQPSRVELKILAEVTSLVDSTPSVVTRCSLVYVSGGNLWKAVWKREMDVLSREHNVDPITLAMWSHLAKELFSDTLMFFRNKELCPVMANDGYEAKQSARITDGLQEVMSFIRILHALLEHLKAGGLKYTSTQTETTVNTLVLKQSCDSAMVQSTQWELQARNLFVVAYIWGFGGHLHPRHWPQFDLFARKALHKSLCKVETPPEGTVFEHFFEFNEEMGNTTNFINCTKRKSPQLFFTPVPQYERHAYLLDILLDAHQPALLVGDSGSGKTKLCKSLISQPRSHMYLPASPCLHSSDLRKTLESVGCRKTQISNKDIVLKQPDLLLFIDDLHEAPFDACGKTSMTLETLRQSMSRREVLTSDGTHFKLFQLKSNNYLATCSGSNPANSNSSLISPRLSRLFTILALPSMTVDILFSVHSSNLQSWLKEMRPMERVANFANCIISSTFDVYCAVREHFTAVSHNAIIIFSLHDIQKVFQGMCLWRPRHGLQRKSSFGVRISSSTGKTVCLPDVLGPVAHELNIAHLWMHECLRTFGDRLASNEACQKLIAIIAEVSENNFGAVLSPETTQTSPDISNTSYLNTSQLEEVALPFLRTVQVQSEQTERVERKSDDSLYSLENDDNVLSYRKDKLKEDKHVANDPATSDCKLQSSICSPPLLFSSRPGDTHLSYTSWEINQKPESQKELSTQRDPLTKCENTAKMLTQLLQEIASSIQNVVFSPEICKPLNNILQYDTFKCNKYQDRDMDMLVDQLIHAVKGREDNKDKKFYDSFCFPMWVLHRQNVHQLVHIFRALLIPGGHGALFGMTKKTGRKTIVRLAAALSGYQLIEVHPGNEGKFQEMLKEAGNQIGIDGRHLVVLVHEDTSQAVKDELLLLMASGTLPGLYSDNEMKNIMLKMKTLMRKKQCRLKDDQALEMYFKNITRNLHVFLLYHLLQENSERQSEKCSVMEKHITKALSLCCCVEVYKPWSGEALVEGALCHLKASHQIPETDNTVAKDSLMASISKVMAGIHLSALKYAGTLHDFQLFSPRSYTELIVYFLCFCRHLCEQSRLQNNRVAKVLERVKDMTDTATRHSQEVLIFKARCEEKQKCLDKLQSSVDMAHKIWEQTRYHSLQEEDWLSCLEEQLCQVQQKVQDAFRQESPLYRAALEALQALSRSDLDEVRRYSTPPDGLVIVMDAICMLFHHPCGWESSKQLLSQSNFFQELEFYDCSKLSDEMIRTLGQIVQAPSFQPSCVRHISRACESLCRWVRAVYEYACVQRHLAPHEAQKRDLDRLIVESRARLRDARLQEDSAQQGLEELEKKLELNRQDMRLLVAKLNTAETQERESSAALRLAERHIEDWESAGKEAKLGTQNIPGDALILAATVTYLGPFRPNVREELLQKWHKLCFTGEINITPEDPRTALFDEIPLTTSDQNVAIPVSKTFQTALKRAIRHDLVHRDHSNLIRRFLLWGNTLPWVQRWALLADVHEHEKLSSQILFPADKFTEDKEKYHRVDKHELIVSADDPELLDKLNHGAQEGLSVLVTHIERVTPNLKMLEAFVQSAGSCSPGQSRPLKDVHPHFCLFMSTPLPVQALINEIQPSFLDKVQIIDLSLSTTEVQDLILTELMQSECFKLWALHCEVQKEKQTLQHKLFQNEASLMEYIMDTCTPLLQDSEFLPHINKCQNVSHALEEDIKVLSQEIDHHKSLMAEFYPVAELTTALYNALQDVARLSSSYIFTLQNFLLTLRAALAMKTTDVRFQGEMISGTVTAEITHRIVSNFYSQYKPCLFSSHAELLRLLVSVAFIEHNEGCSEAERVTFLRGLSDLKSSKWFLALSTESLPELPSWIHKHIQADVYLLDSIAPFRGLASSLVNSSKEWQEYLRFPSSTVIEPVPCQSHSHLSLMQRAILWKTLCPHWLAAVEEDLAVCVQGHLLASVFAGGSTMWSPEVLSHFLSKNDGPVVVHLPESEETTLSIHPLHLIKQVAQYQVNMKGVKVTVISFGSGCHRNTVLTALECAVQNGHWLVLNNCHLLDCWDVRVVNELTQLISCTSKVTDLEADGGLALNDGDGEKQEHPHFRLWFITKGDSCHSVPAAVRINALHLVCDSFWDLKDELCSSVIQTLSAAPYFSSPGQTEDTVRPLLQCAILHSVLLQRQAFKHLGQGKRYDWTQEDLLALIDAHVRIAKHCNEPTGVLEYIAGYLIYGNHVSDCADLAAVQSVIRVCLREPSTLWGRGPHILSDVIHVKARFDAECLIKGLRHRIHSITSGIDPLILGFSPSMTRELVKLKSHTLDILLHQSQNICRDVRETSRPLLQPQELSDYKNVGEQLLALQDKLVEWKKSGGGGMESASLGLLRHFFQAELESLGELISSLLLDNFQPVKYINITGCSPAYLTSSAVSRLETQADLLRSYLWEESTSTSPHAYQLSAFLNPQGFLAALIRDAAYIQKKDIGLFYLHFKVLQKIAPPSSPPLSGVCLSGLELQGARWDPKPGVLTDTLSPNPTSFPPLWVTAKARHGDRTSFSDSSRCDTSSSLYYCPLYIDRQTADGDLDLAAENIVTHVPLPTRLDPMFCSMRRIRLTSTL